MSGYPYGGPPSTQPYGGGGYGTPPAGYGIPYGVGAPPAAGEKPSKSHKVGDYHPSVPPSSAPYAAASSQYSGVKPSKTGYQPSAPPATGPYGGYVDPYSAGSEKPSKAQQGGGYGDPYSEKPSKAQKGSGYGDPYSEKPSNPQQAINDPEGFLLEWWSVFWGIFIARTNEKHSPAAAAYIESIWSCRCHYDQIAIQPTGTKIESKATTTLRFQAPTGSIAEKTCELSCPQWCYGPIIF